MRILICIWVMGCLTMGKLQSQPWLEWLDSSQAGSSYRGLCVLPGNTLWVSGSKGRIGRSTNGGKTWQWVNPAGYETRDFRDIEAFDSLTALAMAVDRPALILRTTDGGRHWQPVYERDIPGVFLDAMCFKDKQRGVCIGDPINERFWIVETHDGGVTWKEVPASQSPLAMEGEALFASSGSNIQFINYPGLEYAFITGGTISRLHLMGGRPGIKNGFIDLGMPRGRASKGANSLAVQNDNWIIVGGDYTLPLLSEYNTVYSTDNSSKWSSPGVTPPFGYKSSTLFIAQGRALAVGTSGIDVSGKNLNHWKHLTDQPFHVAAMAPGDNWIYLAGPAGKIARMPLPPKKI